MSIYAVTYTDVVHDQNSPSAAKMHALKALVEMVTELGLVEAAAEFTDLGIIMAVEASGLDG